MKSMYLVTARKAAGYSQDALARKAGVQQAQVSRLETKPNTIASYYLVTALAKVLKVEPGALLFGPDPATQQEAR